MLTPETLKAALELTSVPMLAVSADGRVVLLNSEFEELIGYKTEEIAGQPVEQLLPRTTRDRHGQFVQAFMKVPAKRKMGQGRTLMGLSKSGQEIPLELGLNIVDVDGVPHCIVVAVDVRVKRSYQHKMELAMEAAATAMIMVDTDGIIVLANEAAVELSGYSRKELLGANVDKLVPTPEQVPHKVFRSNYLFSSKKDNLRHPRRIKLRQRSGSLVPIEISLTPVDTPEGSMVMSTITDLTHRVEAERAMKGKNRELADANRKLGEANGELTQFAYAVSHDLKAPLASLLGLLNLIDDDLVEGDVPSARETVRRATAVCERSRTKVERVLKFAHDTDEEALVPVELPEMVQQAWDSIAPGAPIETDLACDFDVETIVAKPTGIEIILHNLLDNAVKYHDPRKKRAKIHVSSRKASGGVEITVRDQGVGISTTHHKHIFDMFRRADPRSGDGIGLALVKKQVTRHGGRIGLDSAVGQGTAITVFLPQQQKPQYHRPKEPAQEGTSCTFPS